METLLEHWLSGGSPGALAEASAHFAWGMVAVLFGYVYGGHRGAKQAALWMLAYAIYKEFAEDGHFVRLLEHKESFDEARDFVTDLITRIVPLALTPRLLPMKRKGRRNAKPTM